MSIYIIVGVVIAVLLILFLVFICYVLYRCHAQLGGLSYQKGKEKL